MRTTVNLPVELLQQVEKLTQASSRREALIIALTDFVRRQRRRRVVDAAGTLEFELSAREIRKRSKQRLELTEE